MDAHTEMEGNKMLFRMLVDEYVDTWLQLIKTIVLGWAVFMVVGSIAWAFVMKRVEEGKKK